VRACAENASALPEHFDFDLDFAFLSAAKANENIDSTRPPHNPKNWNTRRRNSGSHGIECDGIVGYRKLVSYRIVLGDVEVVNRYFSDTGNVVSNDGCIFKCNRKRCICICISYLNWLICWHSHDATPILGWLMEMMIMVMTADSRRTRRADTPCCKCFFLIPVFFSSLLSFLCGLVIDIWL